MKKSNWILTLILMVSLLLSAALADAAPDAPFLPAVEVDPEYTAEYQQALNALLAHSPGAAVNYAVRERDDDRYEWNLFFTLNGQLGQAEIYEDSFEVRRVNLLDMPEGGLTAAQAMDVLAREKGEIKIIDLELDRDDGRISYEGEASLGEKRYEFEIAADGRIIEWERD